MSTASILEDLEVPSQVPSLLKAQPQDHPPENKDTGHLEGSLTLAKSDSEAWGEPVTCVSSEQWCNPLVA